MQSKNLSIITINKNNSAGLRKTLASISAQMNASYELIVIDAASSDGSLDVIHEYSSVIHFWSSEPDTGIYQAMNKGFKQSSGDYCLFLNSGDWLAADDTIAQVFRHSFAEDLVYGNIQESTNGNLQQTILSPPPGSITFETFCRTTLPHPATFMRRSLLLHLGGYDESLQISSDWAFFLQAIFLHAASLRYIDKVITIYDTQGISAKPESATIIAKERTLVRQRLFPRFHADYERLAFLENVWNSRGVQTLYSIHLLYRRLRKYLMFFTK